MRCTHDGAHSELCSLHCVGVRTNVPLFPRPTRFLTHYGSTARPTVSRKGFYPNRTDNQTSEQFEHGVRPPKYAPSRGWVVWHIDGFTSLQI